MPGELETELILRAAELRDPVLERTRRAGRCAAARCWPRMTRASARRSRRWRRARSATGSRPAPRRRRARGARARRSPTRSRSPWPWPRPQAPRGRAALRFPVAAIEDRGGAGALATRAASAEAAVRRQLRRARRRRRRADGRRRASRSIRARASSSSSIRPAASRWSGSCCRCREGDQGRARLPDPRRQGGAGPDRGRRGGQGGLVGAARGTGGDPAEGGCDAPPARRRRADRRLRRAAPGRARASTT